MSSPVLKHLKIRTVVTETEISTVLRNICQIDRQPSILLSTLSGGRKTALKQAIQISFEQLLHYSHPDTDPYSIAIKAEMRSLIGKVGGYSQEMPYYLVRFHKPKIVIETGAYRETNSAFILNGIKDNGFGKLYSIDLPMENTMTIMATWIFHPLLIMRRQDSLFLTNLGRTGL